MNKQRLVFVVFAVCCAAGVMFFLSKKVSSSQSVPVTQKQQDKKATAETAKKKAREQLDVSKTKAKSGSVSGVTAQAEAAKSGTTAPAARTEAQRKATEMRELLDSGNEKAALYKVRELMDSDDPVVRAQVVTVAGWLGLKALPELTELLADSDESVAADALAQWQQAFDELEDDGAKANLLAMAMMTLKKTEDLESLAMQFSQVQEGLAVQALVKVMQGNNAKAADAAREQAGFIMGEDSPVTVEQAQSWAAEKILEENGGNQDGGATPSTSTPTATASQTEKQS